MYREYQKYDIIYFWSFLVLVAILQVSKSINFNAFEALLRVFFTIFCVSQSVDSW